MKTRLKQQTNAASSQTDVKPVAKLRSNKYRSILRYSYATRVRQFKVGELAGSCSPQHEAVNPVSKSTAAGKLTNLRKSHARSVALIFATFVAFAVAATPAMAEFGLERFAIGVQNGEGQHGTPDVQAGSHPYSLTTTFVLKQPPCIENSTIGKFECLTEGNLKDVRTELPPGFVGDPTATPRCTYQEFIKAAKKESSSCPNETAIGVATTYLGEELDSINPPTVSASTDPVYNLVPPPGVAAEFGFIVAQSVPVLLQTGVRTGGDYGLTTTVPNISQAILVHASKVTIWGVPASPAHNPIRGTCEAQLAKQRPLEEVGFGLREGEDELEGPVYPVGGFKGLPQSTGEECPSNAPQIPLLTNPTSCGTPRTATLSVDSWKEIGVFKSREASLPPLSGCEKLDFSPTLTVTPDKPDASTSSGLAVNVKVPQETTANPVGDGEADIRDATVVLPPGVALNPAGANGLEACSANPGALAPVGELGSAGDGIGFKGFAEPPLEPGVSLPIFTPYLPGDIASNNAVSTGALNEGENLLQPGVNFCANASKIGTVRFKTPLLEHEVTGDVYLAAQEANPFGSLMAMYAVAEDPVSGSLVKIPGEITLCKGAGEDPRDAAGEPIPGVTCQAVGQVVTTLTNLPQFPVEETEFHFFGGEKAPLTTPAYCGTYTTETSFVPWSAPPGGSSSSVAHPSAEFTIEHGPNGGPCPGSGLPFSPSLTGGAQNLNAGAFSPFTLTMNRSDGEQNIQSVEAHLPPGLSGILSNVELCPEPQANLGECGPNSLIGETTVSVGVGGDPYTVTGGKFYLTGPYNGSGACTVGQAGCAPFGITFTVPAKAGPFDLAHTKSFSPACDCILVRGKIEVNPITTALTITSNPPGTSGSIPTSIEGIPLEIQKINATTTRSNFQFNPTNCSKMEVSGTIHSSEGGADSIGVPFEVTNCQALKFAPKFSVSTQGKTSKADGASLTAKLSYPTGSMGTQANIASVKVDLPKQLVSRLTTLQKACLQSVFERNPAACPAGSRVGTAKATTPLLPVPLTGPAYFVSYGGAKFPELIVVLQGYGVTVDLHGETFISKAGITSSTFRTVPDVPVSTFELTLPEGPGSALAANGTLCQAGTTVTVSKRVKLRVHGHERTVTRKVKQKIGAMAMPTAFTAQNGAVIHQNTPVSVAGCPPARPLARPKAGARKARGAGGQSTPAAGVRRR
jgi:hypothetical protein